MINSKQLPFIPSHSWINLKTELTGLMAHKALKTAIFVSFGIVILAAGMILLLWTKLPSQIPWYYSRPWGEEQLAAKWQLLITLAVCLGLMFVNLRLASLFFKKEVLLAQILTWSTLTLVVLLGITIVKILLIVV